jgi:hypothetical protein
MCIGLLAACLIKEGKRVLLVSNTNKAVDGAISAVLETQQIINEIDSSGDILRLGGKGITEEFRSEWGDHLFDAILEERGVSLKSELMKIELQRDEVTPHVSRLRSELANIEELESCRSRIEPAQELITKERRKSGRIDANLAQLIHLRRKLEEEWADAPDEKSIADKLTRKRSKDEVEKLRDDALKDFERVSEELREAQDKIAQLGTELEGLHNRITELTALVKTYRPKAEIQSDYDGYAGQLAELNQRLAEIEAALSALGRKILSEASLVAATVHKTFLDTDLSEIDFDAVIVDEASMVVLPMVYWAAGRARSQIAVVGDFRQLPAIVKDQESEFVQDWVAKSPFDKWNIPELLKTASADTAPYLVILQEQNRMHPEIGGLVSELFYRDIATRNGSGLMAGPVAKSRAKKNTKLPSQKTFKRISIIDTKDLGAWSSPPFGGSGRFNPTHVALGLALLDKMIAEDVVVRGEPNQIGFVTPYSGQAKLYADALGNEYSGFCDATSVGTAHRFQGAERDIMLFDYVLSEGRTYPNKFIDSETGLNQPGNLLNVALSRAKHHLVVIYNSKEFTERSTHPWMLSFFDTLRDKSEELDALALLEASALGRIHAAAEGAEGPSEAIGSHPYNESQFYPKVTADLERANFSVTVFSAFATPPKLSQWMDLFQRLLRRGLRLRLVTKPIQDQPKPKTYGPQLKEMFERIRASGIVLDTRTVTHEKVVVIDEEIVWHGSLNMFSQNEKRTTELMTRTVSKSYAKSILGLLARHDLKQNDLHAQQLPVCPTCRQPTQLLINWQQAQTLWCSQDCGFIAGSWDFGRLSRGVPIGRILGACEKCRDGEIKVSVVKGKLAGKCSNSRPKKGEKKCSYVKEISHSKLDAYEPFPEPQAPNPDALTGMCANDEAKTEPGATRRKRSEISDRANKQKPSKQHQARKEVTRPKKKRVSTKPKQAKPRPKTLLKRAKPAKASELDSILSSLLGQ